jgi:hypothetical protein
MIGAWGAHKDTKAAQHAQHVRTKSLLLCMYAIYYANMLFDSVSRLFSAHVWDVATQSV